MMKVGGGIQYEPDVPYCKHYFSFKMYHTPLYLSLFVRQMPQVISYFTNSPLKKNVASAASLL